MNGSERFIEILRAGKLGVGAGEKAPHPNAAI